MNNLIYLVVFAALSICFADLSAWPQTPPIALPESGLTLSTDSVGPVRFVAVHGRRSAIFGYPKNGLEAESRRHARFQPFGHSPGRQSPKPAEFSLELPYTLDLRLTQAP